METVVLVAAHGERRPDADHAPIGRFTDRLARLLPGLDVRFALINAEPTIATVLADAGSRRIVVYPLLMADGFFLSRLKDLVAASRPSRPVIWPCPLGLDPGLADSVLARISREAIPRGRPLSRVDLVMSAHGSKVGTKPREAATALATRIAQRQRLQSVALGFVEEPPHLVDAFTAAPPEAWHVGLFAGAGVHAAGDVPKAIKAAGRTDILDLGLISEWPEATDLAAAAIHQALVGGEGLEPPTSCV